MTNRLGTFAVYHALQHANSRIPSQYYTDNKILVTTGLEGVADANLLFVFQGLTIICIIVKKIAATTEKDEIIVNSEPCAVLGSARRTLAFV